MRVRSWIVGIWSLLIVAMLVAGAATIGQAGTSASGLSLHIWKGMREMKLQRGDRVIRTFDIVLGFNPRLSKERQGDGRTPEGRYKISEKMRNSQFHRFLAINYPSFDDAERAIDRHDISDDDWADIFFAHLERKTPPSSTVLGGRIGIHGYAGRPYLPLDWTKGCIAVSDAEIEYLFNHISVGTPVYIYE